MGVIDPYDCLEEGEVFVQYCKQVQRKRGKYGDKLKSVLMKGPMLVTRNPCVHPGDIRIVKGVDKSELQDYVNVIVFSSKGKRPEQDKMASGDLDGDIYWINWREDFVKNYTEKPPNGEEDTKDDEGETKEIVKTIDTTEKETSEFGWNSSDSDDNNSKQGSEDPDAWGSSPNVDNEPTQSEEEITKEKCIQNFIEFIKNDMLGEVANLHSKISDSDINAINTETCLKLAEMHSKAVDFQKHGEMLDIEEFESLKRENNYNVDFMSHGKKNIKKNQIVESTGILGKMYRQLKDDMDQDELLKLEYEYKIQRNYSAALYANGNLEICEHLLWLYKTVVKPYNDEIRQIMIEKGLSTESDIFNSNCAFTNMVNSRDEMYGHQDDIEMLMNEFEDRFKYGFIKGYKSDIGLKKCKCLSEAIKFVTYFDLSHLEQKELEPYKDNDCFQKFVEELKVEQEKENLEPLDYEEYKKIVCSGYTEELELKEIIDRVKILSAWWILVE